PARRPRHRPGGPTVRTAGRGVAARPRGARWAAELVLAGCAERVLLGKPGTGGAAAPRHLVDQLDLSCLRPASLPDTHRRPGRELLAPGRHLLRRELAQLAPRRPDLRPPRCPARPTRPERPADLVAGEGRLGPP